MSTWFFFSDWFSGASTWGALFMRSIINALCAIALIFALALFNAPADVAVAVIFGMFALNGLMFFYFQQQRR